MTKSTEKEQVMPCGADTGPGLRGCWVWLPTTEVSMVKAEEIAYYPKLYFPPHLQRWEILQAPLKIRIPPSHAWQRYLRLCLCSSLPGNERTPGHMHLHLWTWLSPWYLEARLLSIIMPTFRLYGELWLMTISCLSYPTESGRNWTSYSMWDLN